MNETDKRFWWLKLDRNFFKRHDIRIIQSMDNGEKYVLFYLKLLVESLDHDGRLRFNTEIPYNEKMLSTITETDIDIVRSALQVFENLKLVAVWEDKTIFLSETENMVGSESQWAKKKRDYRSKNNLLDNVRTKKDNVRQEKEKEKEKDLELEKDEDAEKKTPKISTHSPTQSQIDFLFRKLKLKSSPKTFYEHYKKNNWVKKNNQVITVENLEENVLIWESMEFEKPNFSNFNTNSNSNSSTDYEELINSKEI